MITRTRHQSKCILRSSLTCAALFLPGTAFGAAPVVTAFIPADGHGNVNADTATLTITFDQTVQGSTGNITLKKRSDNSTVEAHAGNSAQVSGSGSDTLTVTLLAALGDANIEFYVQIDSTAILNGNGEFYAGIADTTTWNFKTAAGAPEGSAGRAGLLRRLRSRYGPGFTALDLGVVQFATVNQAEAFRQRLRGVSAGQDRVRDEEMEEMEETEETEEMEEVEEPEEEVVPAPEPVRPRPAKSLRRHVRFEKRVCRRVLRHFSLNLSMLRRVNMRLDKRFGFTCTLLKRPSRR